MDGSGNVFVADTGNNAMKEILAAGGYTTVNTLGSGFQRSLRHRSGREWKRLRRRSGNTSVVKLETSAVDFGTVAIGQTSAAISLTFTFDSGGTIGSPVALTQGARVWILPIAGTGTLHGGNSYRPGTTCTVNVTFTPEVRGASQRRSGSKEYSGTPLPRAISTASARGRR